MRGRARARRRQRPGLLLGVLLSAAGLAATLGGCQVLVSASLPAFTCASGVAGACPGGQYCKAAACVPCEAQDLCDGFDNDCNGRVDDGEGGFDRDGDGFTPCGRADPATGRLIETDCNDDDRTAYPGASEVCNGKDDDCDGVADNPGLACPTGEVCAGSPLRCIAGGGACTPESCPAPRVCEPATQQCVLPASAKAGELCASDRQCDTGICGDTATLGKAVTDLTGNICTRPCCTSEDCPKELVCHASGLGGSYCVPKAALAIRAALGARGPGEACQADADCRSGVCDGSMKRCMDVCCTTASCKGGWACRLLPSVRGKPAFACTPPAGTINDNERCANDADCKSGLCLLIYYDAFGNPVRRCNNPCCGSAACGTIRVPGTIFTPEEVSQLACRPDVLAETGELGSVCGHRRAATGKGKVSDPCANEAACESELCVPASDGVRRCTDTCCRDEDCGVAGWICRPTSEGNKLALRCGKK